MDCRAGRMDKALCTYAIHALETVAGDTSQHPHDRKCAVYELLRYATIIED